LSVALSVCAAALPLTAGFVLSMASASAPMKVAVTGAGGRTGGLVFKKLLSAEGLTPVGVVRSGKSANNLKKKTGASDDQIALGNALDKDSVKSALEGCDAMVIATSAVPKIKPLSILKVLIFKLLQKAARPEFYWEPKGTPEEVDWIGQKNQIDAAKEAGVKRVVIVSSMGGTQPENFLNTIGKKEDGTGGDILLWKRKAEQYLIKSGLKYTIIHPGGLIDKDGGKRKIVMDIDDKLLERKTRSIPRADVAEVCVQSLLVSEAINRSVDICSEDEGDGEPTTDFKMLFKSCKGNCNYKGSIEPIATDISA